MKRLNVKVNVVTSIASFSVNIILTFISYKVVLLGGGVSDLGLWSALSALIYLMRVGDAGMSNAAERYIAATDVNVSPARVSGLLGTALLVNAVLFSALAFAGWLILEMYLPVLITVSEQEQSVAISMIPVMLVGFIFINISNVLYGGIRGLHLGWLASVASTVSVVVQLIIVVILVPKIGIEGLAWAQLYQAVTASLIAWLFFVVSLSKLSKTNQSFLRLGFSIPITKELLGFSLRAQGVNILNGLLEPMSKLLVGNSAGLALLGIYEVAYKVVALPRNALVAGALAISPAMTSLLAKDVVAARRLYQATLKRLSIYSGLAMLVVSLGSPIAAILIFGSSDKVFSLFVLIMASGFWLNAIGAPAYILGFSSGRLRGNVVSTACSMIALFSSYAILVNVSATFGPVLASALALAVGGGVVFSINRKLLLNGR